MIKTAILVYLIIGTCIFLATAPAVMKAKNDEEQDLLFWFFYFLVCLLAWVIPVIEGIITLIGGSDEN